MGYIDKRTDFFYEKLLDYIDLDELAENDAHISAHFDIEHTANPSDEGEHNAGFITKASDYLADGSVTGSKVLADNVTSIKIAFYTLTGGNIGSSSVGQGELYTTYTAELAETSSTLLNRILTGGEYGFYPQIKMSTTGSSDWEAMITQEVAYNGWTAAYVSSIALATGGGGTIYARQRYIQSSPPYKIGDTIWGHFLFLLRNPLTGEIFSAYSAEDPPWAYNGIGEKDSVERIQSVPHPFMEYWEKDPAIDGLEICLVDLRDLDVEKLITTIDLKKYGILEEMLKLITIDKKGINYNRFNIPEILGFTDKLKIRGRI
jgi:hypothetical protein